jgi:cytochrome c oxidase subunit II
MWERYITAASTYAHRVDYLFILIALVVGFWLLAAEGMMFWLIFRFRARDGRPTQYITGEEPHLKRWISIPHYIIILCDIVILAGAISVWYQIKQTMPPANPESVVRVIGQQWAWSFQQPGPDGVLDTADDIRTVGELHVVLNTTYHFELLSRDVIHSFAVPAFRLKQDALPGRAIAGWFTPNRVGTYDIQCTQICGIGHAMMAGRIIVETPKDHAAWLLHNSSPAAVPQQAAAAPGETGATAMAEVRR